MSPVTVQLLRDLLLALCLVGGWAIIGFHIVLTVAGYVYSQEARRRRPAEPDNWPGVSILVPAYNEEIVMAGTLESGAKQVRVHAPPRTAEQPAEADAP